VGQTISITYLLISVLSQVIHILLSLFLVFGFVDKEGIITETGNYVDELAVLGN